MPLVFKLVGYTADKKHYEIKDPFNGPINLKLLFELYKVWGLTDEEISNIKFITDSEQIKNSEKSFLVKDDEDRVIFVFTSNATIRQKLHEIFIREGSEVQIGTKTSTNTTTTTTTTSYTTYSSSNETPVSYAQPANPDPEICTPITQVVKPDPIPVLTQEVIDTMNVKSVSLFADEDFKHLVSIYMRKPDLFSVLAKYVQNGTVIEESLGHVTTPDMLTDDVLANYKKLCQEIKNLGFTAYSDEVIMGKLIKYSGHLNLTVRALLCEQAQTQTSSL
jgi:hypothetical protein